MSSDAAELPTDASSTKVLLALQRAEVALVKADLAAPGTPAADIRRLRYLLGFARLTRFQPGAAEHGPSDGRDELDVAAEVEPFRAQVLRELADPVNAEGNPAHVLRVALEAGHRLDGQLRTARSALLDRHPGALLPRELDAECGRKQLVLAAGGGGGAGWVYVGAGRRLDQAGITPSYIIGSSIGSVYGALRSRFRDPDWDAYLALIHGLDRRELFSTARRKRRYGLPGLLSLRLRSSVGHLFDDDGEPLRLNELEIPYDSVVAGVRRSAFNRLPRRFRLTAASMMRRAAPLARYSERSLAPAIATRMWQVAAFFDPRVVKPIVLGSDPLTARFDTVDAAGFSAAIPGVLHYDIDEDSPMEPVLAELAERDQIAALIDGGVASNVPTEQAWRRIQAGRLGTRNALVLAWDCFHPQWDPRHLWLVPITQAIALQQVRNRPFADLTVQFSPTLSPLDLVPEPSRFDQAVEWGAASIEPSLELLAALLEPVGWTDPGT